MHLLTLTLRQPGTPQVTLYYDDAASANAALQHVHYPTVPPESAPLPDPDPAGPIDSWQEAHPEIVSVARDWFASDDPSSPVYAPATFIDLHDHHGQRFSCQPHDIIAAMVSDTERLGVVAEERAKQEIALQRKLQAGMSQGVAMPGIGGLGIGRRQ